MNVQLQHSHVVHGHIDSEEETLCGIQRSQIQDGGDWWYTEREISCKVCIAARKERDEG